MPFALAALPDKPPARKDKALPATIPVEPATAANLLFESVDGLVTEPVVLPDDVLVLEEPLLAGAPAVVTEEPPSLPAPLNAPAPTAAKPAAANLGSTPPFLCAPSLPRASISELIAAALASDADSLSWLSGALVLLTCESFPSDILASLLVSTIPPAPPPALESPCVLLSSLTTVDDTSAFLELTSSFRFPTTAPAPPPAAAVPDGALSERACATAASAALCSSGVCGFLGSFFA